MSSLLKPPTSARSRPLGFSLIELGIVIAVITVLGAVIIASKGYIVAAKKQTAVELVKTLRTAAQGFAMRHNNGVAFAKTAGSSKDDLDFGFLMSEGFLPVPTTTPWGSTQIKVRADSGAKCGSLGGSNCTKCAGFACIFISFPVEDPQTCLDLGTQFGPTGSGGIAAKCNGVNLEMVTR